MPDPISANKVPLTIVDGAVSTPDSIGQIDTASPDAPASSAEKAHKFEAMLNDQQKITELKIKYETMIFDPAQDIEINAAFSSPAKNLQP